MEKQTKTRAAKAAAAVREASRGRQSLLSKVIGYGRSPWVWGFVALVAVYLGFFYEQKLVRYSVHIEDGLPLQREFGAPTRHFRLIIRDVNGQQSLPAGFDPSKLRVHFQIQPPLQGRAGNEEPARAEVHDLGGGELRVAFQVTRGVPSGHALRLKTSYRGGRSAFVLEPAEHVISGPVHEPTCFAPVQAPLWAEATGCPSTFSQLTEAPAPGTTHGSHMHMDTVVEFSLLPAIQDMLSFPTVDLAAVRSAIGHLTSKRKATSLIHYVVKDNRIYKKPHGPFPGFSYFSDLALLQLASTVKLPDVEFLLNVGDWPLVSKSVTDLKVPVFSWCGSTNTHDVVLPQWEVTRSSVLGSRDGNADLLAAQGWATREWKSRISRAAFRGRDSNRVRVDLARLSRRHSDVLDVGITSWENDEYVEIEEELGGASKFIKLNEFSKYKYNLLLDGTVAAYRNPFLLSNGSLMLKQDSPYYEWYQKDLTPMQHFVPFDGTGDDLLRKIQWAKENDEEAQRIASRAMSYARQNLLPERVLCYYYRALEMYASKQNSKPEVTSDMVWVAPPEPNHNTCGAPEALLKDSDYPVVPLYPSTVGKMSASKDTVILVHSAFCNKSVALLPKFLMAARAYKAAGADLHFASADTFSLDFGKSWLSKSSRPKLFFLRAGATEPEPLEGKLTITTAVTFINSKIQNVKHRIDVPEEEERIVSDPIPEKNDGPVKVVVADSFEDLVLKSKKDVLLMVSAPWCGHCKRMKPEYFRFARTVAASPSASSALVVAKLNGPTNEIRSPGFDVTGYPTIWLVRNGEKTPVRFTGTRTAKALFEFVKQHSTNPKAFDGIANKFPEAKDRSGANAVEWDAATFQSVLQKQESDLLLLVYAPWCGHCKKFEPTYDAFAKRVAASKSASDTLVVAKMDGTVNSLTEEKYQITGYPTVWFFKRGSDTPVKFMGSRTEKGLLSFVQQHASAKVDVDVPEETAPEAKSEEPPAANDGPVKVVVGKTFKSMVVDSDKDVLLLVYAPWCGHCKKLEPTYEEFAKRVAESKSASNTLIVAKMDGTVNRLTDEKYQITGYPTVWFFKRGSDTPVEFRGSRTAKGLLSFVQQHASAKVEVDVPEDPAPEAKSEEPPASNDGPVKVVVGKTFKSMVVDSDKDVLLLVYAPWCGHCKKLEPTYEEFAKRVAASKSASDTLVVAKMDGTVNRLTEEKYQVTGYPTVWFFKRGSDTPVKFMGSRTEKGLLSFVQQHASAKVEVDVPEEPAPEAKSEEPPAANDGAVKVVVGKTFKSMVVDSDKDVLLLVYAPWCGYCKKLEPTYEEFAKRVAASKSASDTLVVAKMDGTASTLTEEKYQVTGYPTVWFFKRGSDTPVEFKGSRTAKGLLSFVQQHASAKVEVDVPEEPAPEAKSEEPPASNDGPVKVVVGKTFKSMVVDSDKDVLLLVYAPWCGHCKKLEPTYEEFAKRVAASKSASDTLVVAKMDGTVNRLTEEKYQITGYPTVWFFKRGSDTPIKFVGNRTADGLLSFVQQHSSGAGNLDI